MGTSKKRPEHCDQGAHRQHRDKDELPRTSRWRRGKMSLRIYAASKRIYTASKTRRRLSGWSSKIRICCIFLRAAFVAGKGCPEPKSNRRLRSLMTKIFLA